MKETANYKLKKPDGNDNVNIEDLNYNADVVDSKLKEVETSVDSIEVPVTSVNEKTGDVVLNAEDVGAVATEEGKGLSTNDYTNEEKNKLSGIQSGAQVNTVTSVAGKTGAVVVSKSDVGLSNVDNVKQASKTEFDSHVGSKSVHGLKDSTIAIGANSSVDSDGSIAIGSWAKANGGDKSPQGLALGWGATASNANAMAIGVSVSAANYSEGVLGGAEAIESPKRWIIPGELNVSGTKNFEIPHPKPEKSATHVIRHGAVESPTPGDTLYRWKIQATKDNDIITIDLPDYFVWLNTNVQIFVTPQGHFGNGYGTLNRETERLEIHCQFAGEYNVLVIGTRNDDHQSVQDWGIKGVEREIGESWTGETYVFEVDEILEIEEIKEVV